MKKSKIKIIYTIGDFGVGGKERQLIEVLKVIDENKFDVTLIVKKLNAHYASNIPQHVTLINLERKSFGITSWFIFLKLLKNIKPDIVHSWATPTSFIFSVLKLIPFTRKYKLIDGSIRQAHNTSSKFSYYGIQRKIIKQYSDLIVSNSKAGLVSYKIINKGIVVYNGFDLNRIKNIQPNNKHDNCFIVGMVARFDPIKDYPTYIQAALEILDIRTDMHFYAIGSGPLLPSIQAMIPFEKQDYFSFTGSVSDVENYVAQFDIAVLASHSEGISNSILEYMALAKPIIASGSGGTPEIISHEKNGFLLKTLDVSEMKAHILRLLDDAILRSEIGESGFKTLLDNFSIDSMKQTFERNYLKLINEK